MVLSVTPDHNIKLSTLYKNRVNTKLFFLLKTTHLFFPCDSFKVKIF